MKKLVLKYIDKDVDIFDLTEEEIFDIISLLENDDERFIHIGGINIRPEYIMRWHIEE